LNIKTNSRRISTGLIFLGFALGRKNSELNFLIGKEFMNTVWDWFQLKIKTDAVSVGLIPFFKFFTPDLG
jgi:hypothetical protein